MAEREHEKPLDDFAVEITDLDRPEEPARPPRVGLTSRQRRLGAVFTVLAFVLVIGLLLGSMSDVRNLVEKTLRPLLAPTARPNALAVYLISDPAWGDFTLDGKLLTHVPVMGQDQPLKLAFGKHTLTWQAEPFGIKTCTFTAINATQVQSPCSHNNEIYTAFNTEIQATIFTFCASLNDLPVAQRTHLVQQLQSTLSAYNSSASVSQGNLYAVSMQAVQEHPGLCQPMQQIAVCYAHATQPLIATLDLRLDTSSSLNDPCLVGGECEIDQQDCRTLCAVPDPTISGWNVEAIVNLLWSYRTLAGQVLASDQPDTAIRGAQSYQFAAVHLDWLGQNQWRITFFPQNLVGTSDPLCTQAAGDAMVFLGAGTQNTYVSQTFDLPSHMASGCVTSVGSSEDPTSATPASTADAESMPYFLLRFGVLLAANSAARKLYPFLPSADVYEQNLAQTLVALN